jgi:hypothetical protein
MEEFVPCCCISLWTGSNYELPAVRLNERNFKIAMHKEIYKSDFWLNYWGFQYFQGPHDNKVIHGKYSDSF